MRKLTIFALISLLTACMEPQPIEEEPNPFSIVGTVELPGYGEDIWLDGNLAYVATGEAGLTVIDISDPTNPVVIGRWDGVPRLSQYYSRGIFKFQGDSVVYVADDDGGTLIIDVRDPSNPTYFGSLPWLHNVRDIEGFVLADTPFVVVSRYDEGVVAINCITSAQRGWANLLGYSNGIAIDTQRHLVLVANGQCGLMVVDYNNITNPTVRAQVDTRDRAVKVQIYDTLAFVADWSGGVVVVSVANPDSAYTIAQFDVPGVAKDVAFDGMHIFVAAGSHGLCIFDPSYGFENSELIAQIETENALSVKVRNDTAFVGTRGMFYIVAPTQ